MYYLNILSGGAPEKLWRLKSRQIVIDLLDEGMDE